MTDDATAYFDVRVPAPYFDIQVPAPGETWEEADAAERAELRARVEAALEQLRQSSDLEEIAIAPATSRSAAASIDPDGRRGAAP